jgi:hypothetical protein
MNHDKIDLYGGRRVALPGTMRLVDTRALAGAAEVAALGEKIGVLVDMGLDTSNPERLRRMLAWFPELKRPFFRCHLRDVRLALQGMNTI